MLANAALQAALDGSKLNMKADQSSVAEGRRKNAGRFTALWIIISLSRQICLSDICLLSL